MLNELTVSRICNTTGCGLSSDFVVVLGGLGMKPVLGCTDL